MLAQFSSWPVLTTALQHPGDIDCHVFRETLLLLRRRQPAEEKQVFGKGGGRSTLLAFQREGYQGAENQILLGEKDV